MKSFLDRFRRKGSDNEPRPAELARDVGAEALKKHAQASGGVLSGGATSGTETQPQAATAPPRHDPIVFALGDFLPRIPAQLLANGEHDPDMPLKFESGELSSRIARGQTTIPLSEIYRRAPNIFRGEIRESDNIEIRFPWRRLLDLVKSARAGAPQPTLSEEAAEALAQKLRARKRALGTELQVRDDTAHGPGVASRQPSWFTRSTSAPVPSSHAPPAEEPTPTPPAESVTSPTPLESPVPADAAATSLAPSSAPPADLDIVTELERITRETDEQVERLRKGYEETIAILKQENATLISERDKAREELEAARKELAKFQPDAGSGTTPGQ
jgi:hypothetical protein